MFFDELLEKALVAFEDGTQHPAVGVDAFPHRFGREIGSAVFAVEQQRQHLREDLKNPAAGHFEQRKMEGQIEAVSLFGIAFPPAPFRRSGRRGGRPARE